MTEENLSNNSSFSVKEVLSISKNLSISLACFAGIFVFFIYTFIDIQFFPSGVSLGDSILFILLALAVGVIYLALIYIAVFLALPIRLLSSKVQGTEEQCQRKQNEDNGNISEPNNCCCPLISLKHKLKTFFKKHNLDLIILIILYVLASIAILLSMIIYFLSKGNYIGLFGVPILFMLVGTAVLEASQAIENIFTKKINAKEEIKKSKKMIIFGVFLVVVFPISLRIFDVDILLAKTVFSGFGIRTENATIQVPKDTFNQISELHKVHKMTLDEKLVTTSTDSNLHYINNVTVLWHRIGDTSYIQFSDKNKFFRMEVDRSNLNVSKESAY